MKSDTLLVRAVFRPLLIGIAIFFSAASLAARDVATLAGGVVSIHDGDTLTILVDNKRQERIRLAGVDAPERGQAFGEVSRQHLASLVSGKQVVVEWRKRDKYHRIVGKVLLDHKDVNLEQVRAGLAWHYRMYMSEQSMEDRQRYASAEQEARASLRGLWRDAAPKPPWEYRRSKK